MTARLQLQIESEFPKFSGSLLGVLYPQFLSPIPSMSVAQFLVDPDQGTPASGFDIPAHTPLFTRSREGEICRFRTGYPVTLWPFTVQEAGFESTDKYAFLDHAADVAIVLKIRIKSMTGNFMETNPSRLRFFINGDRMLSNSLYELLFSNVSRVALLGETEKTPRLFIGRRHQARGPGPGGGGFAVSGKRPHRTTGCSTSISPFRTSFCFSMFTIFCATWTSAKKQTRILTC